MARKILVVDDSEVVLGVTQAMLEEAGYEVSTNRRATGSVALILHTKPDLVLLDVNMPSLRGDMIARMSVATNNSTGTIVVLHSTLPESELQRLAKESDAHGYIKKTDNVHQFIRRVRHFLDEAPTSSFKIADRAASSEREPYPSSRKQGKRKTVLLVDGDMTALSALRREIQALGYEPSFALSSFQANAKIQSQLPDIIVVSDQLQDLEKFLQTLSFVCHDRLVLVRDERSSLSIPPFARVILRPVSSNRLQSTLAQVVSDRSASTGS